MFSEDDEGEDDEEEEASMSPPKKKEMSLGKRPAQDDANQLIKRAMAEDNQADDIIDDNYQEASDKRKKA